MATIEVSRLSQSSCSESSSQRSDSYFHQTTTVPMAERLKVYEPRTSGSEKIDVVPVYDASAGLHEAHGDRRRGLNWPSDPDKLQDVVPDARVMHYNPRGHHPGDTLPNVPAVAQELLQDLKPRRRDPNCGLLVLVTGKSMSAVILKDVEDKTEEWAEICPTGLAVVCFGKPLSGTEDMHQSETQLEASNEQSRFKLESFMNEIKGLKPNEVQIGLINLSGKTVESQERRSYDVSNDSVKFQRSKPTNVDSCVLPNLLKRIADYAPPTIKNQPPSTSPQQQNNFSGSFNNSGSGKSILGSSFNSGGGPMSF